MNVFCKKKKRVLRNIVLVVLIVIIIKIVKYKAAQEFNIIVQVVGVISVLCYSSGELVTCVIYKLVLFLVNIKQLNRAIAIQYLKKTHFIAYSLQLVADQIVLCS